MKKSYFQWGSELVTGIASIDNQHKGLIEIINDALQLCFNNEAIEKEKIKEIYKRLSFYIVEHFDTEEELMKKYSIDFRHAKVHSDVHLDFENIVKHYFSDISILVEPSQLGDVVEYLIRWLAYHILNIDKSLARQITLIENKGITPHDAFEQEEKHIEVSTEPLLKALRSLFLIVSEKNKALTKANADLEEKVRRRTLELTEVNKMLESMSMHDEMTGLNNRRYAISEINKLIYNSNRYGTTFSILFIDVDKFKAVNDNYGHEFGDKVLKWLANYFRDSLRDSDIPCRLGGDEFLIICDHCDAESAMKTGNKIIEEIKKYNIEKLSNCWEPSLSIGIAEIDKTCISSNDILKKADKAMYVAKKKGGNKVACEEL